MIENHNQILDTANKSLSRNILILVERIRELYEKFGQAFMEAHRLQLKVH